MTGLVIAAAVVGAVVGWIAAWLAFRRRPIGDAVNAVLDRRIGPADSLLRRQTLNAVERARKSGGRLGVGTVENYPKEYRPRDITAGRPWGDDADPGTLT